MNATALLAIGVGAVLGAWLRYGLGLWLNPVFATVPLGTLAANLVGGYLVGVAVADENRDDGLKPPAAGTLLKLLWPGVAQAVFAAALADGPPPETAVAGIDPACFVPPLVRLAAVAVPAALRAIPSITW